MDNLSTAPRGLEAGEKRGTMLLRGETRPMKEELLTDRDNGIDKTGLEGYTVKVARSVEEVESLRGAWEQMQWHPNADIDFYLTILASRDEILRPYIVQLSSSGRPKAMMIGRIVQQRLDFKVGYKTIFRPKVRVLTFIYGGLLGEQTYEEAETLVAGAMASLKRDEADVVFFNHLPLDSHIYKLTRSKLGLLWRDYFTQINLHWKMSLPDTIAEFYQNLSPKRRHEFKRKDRVLNKAHSGNVTVRCIRERHLVDRLIEDVESVARNTYQRGLETAFIANDETRRRLCLASERGWLRAYLLYVDGKPCCFWIGTLYGKTFFLDFTGFDPSFKKYEPGTLLFIKMVEDLCQNNIKEVDFGFGDAIYKQHFCDQSWKEASVYIFPPTLKGMKLNALKMLTVTVNESAKKILKGLGALERAKRIWRERFTPK